MTHAAQMQQPAEDLKSMFPTESGGIDNQASETTVDSYRSLDPATVPLEDYTRSMLLYTQRQMSSSVDSDDSHRNRSSSSRSGQSSSQSSRSSASSGSGTNGLARQANGPPTSVNNAAYLVESKISGLDLAGSKSAGY